MEIPVSPTLLSQHSNRAIVAPRTKNTNDTDAASPQHQMFPFQKQFNVTSSYKRPSIRRNILSKLNKVKRIPFYLCISVGNGPDLAYDQSRDKNVQGEHKSLTVHLFKYYFTLNTTSLCH